MRQEFPINVAERNIALIALREYGGVGPKTLLSLLMAFGSLEELFNSSYGSIAALPRMSSTSEEKIRSSIDNAALIEDRLDDYRNRGIGVVTLFDNHYPESLLKLSSHPPMLYYRGNIDITRDNCVAIVGTHKASSDWIAEAVRLGKNIASTGVVVVSGLARGIDSGAHVGAIQASGKTIAVLGCGFDNIYPEENNTLSENIVDSGLLISEYPPHTQVSAGRLLARNSIIVGLAQATVVIEITSEKGGTTVAIRETHRQGKGLFTSFDPNKKGTSTNDLGAIHLADGEDWKMVLKYLV